MCNRKFCRNYIRKIKLDLLNWAGKVCELIIYMGQNNKINGKVVFYISEKGRAIERRKIFEKRNIYFCLQRNRTTKKEKEENILRRKIFCADEKKDEEGKVVRYLEKENKFLRRRKTKKEKQENISCRGVKN